MVLAALLPACGSSGSPDDEDAPIDATAAGELGGTPTGTRPSNTPGTYRHRVSVDGVLRETLVYVPEAARGNHPVPVVFMLHGTSGDGEKFYNISGWREKADAEGLIAVFPSALTHCLYEDENRDGDFSDAGEMKVTTKWASGKLGDPAVMPLCTPFVLAQLPAARRALADHPIADDLAYFRAMLDRMPRGYAVDTKRIYATGFSSGASMTSRLALEMADRFASIAASSGSLSLDAAPAARPLSVVFTVGELDDRFMEALGVAALPLDESLLDFPQMQGVAADWLVVTQLGTAYSHTLDTVSGMKVSRFVSTDSLVGASNRFTMQVIEGMTHQYPNGKNHPVVMADVLWETFRTQSLP